MSDKRITEEEVAYVARLAHLKLSSEEEKKITKDLGDILSFIDKLNELDTEKVTPIFQVVPGEGRFREDEVVPSLPREDGLANAPERGNGFFKVPKVIPERKEEG
ncbi:MAG: Asp-tRNA(Asn)/Glu-tRNA(Gln) amidotransferase subunit GatC [Acidobacteria bacterium]|nr:Asp-tRNA(Asn)/Glu-tRNA(Gln) amidotransferase subunit GatC [Acidobacteriota bacterium]